MIDPKYANLPGIAHDQPDVYETEDFPENNHENYAQDDGESVEKIYISPSEAFSKFKDKQGNDKDVSLLNKVCIDARSCNFSSEITSKNSLDELNEALSDKFQRIKGDIKEFIDQINTIKELDVIKDSSNVGTLIDIINQVESAGNDLEALNIEKIFSYKSTPNLFYSQGIRYKELLSQIEIFKRAKSLEKSNKIENTNTTSQGLSKPGSLKYQMIYCPEQAKVEDIARLSYLEKRVGELENIIGISGNMDSRYYQLLKIHGITKSIERLMTNACTLNISQLDVLENKVASLLHKMDGVVQKKMTSVTESKYEKMITELYEKSRQCEKQSQILPQIIDRLTSLSHLHQKAAEFSNQLKELENSRDQINGAVLKNETVLEEVQKNFKKNMEIIANDVTALTERTKNLKK